MYGPLMKPFCLPLKGGNLRFVCESFAFENVCIMSRDGLKAMLQSPFGHLPLWRLLGLLEVRLQLEGSWPCFFQARSRFRSVGISSVADKGER